jgi:GntR family transcriptional regulator
MTVRQALQLLEQEELVVLRHGLGTFVAPKRISYGMGNLRSLAQEVTAQGLELETRVLRRELVQPHPRVAELLQIEPGRPVYALERLRFVGRDPIFYQYSQLQPWLGEALDGVDLSETSLYDYLHDELEVEIARAQEWVRAVTLAEHEATLLEQEPGAPALLSERLTFSGDGEPIMFDRATMPGGRVSLATERFVADVTVGYELRLAEEAP